MVCVDDCAFVRRDGVRAHFQRGADVIDGGLTGVYVQRGCFE